MTDDFYDFEEREAESQGRDHLFLWAIFILLLLGFAIACWLGSFYIFGHPEEARAYHILMKLHKLEPPKRFEITAAPQGEFLGPQKLFERYGRLPPLQLANENAELMRDYIKNYRETKRKAPYVTGKYEIVDAYELQKGTLFTSGMVALAAAVDNPQVLIEHVYPAAPENVAKLHSLLQPGLDVKLEKTLDLAAIIHVERTGDGRFLFTVVPLLYGNYALKQGVGTFSLEPPEQLNLPGGLPIIRGKDYLDAMRRYADFRREKPEPAAPDEATPPQEPELVRLDTVRPGEKVPETGALPEVPVATPIPLSTPRIASRAATPRGRQHPATPPALTARVENHGAPSPTPAQLALNATPRPRASAPAPPTPAPMAKPEPAVPPPAEPPPPPPPSVAPSGVPLKPFIASTADPSVRPLGGSWRTYAPGQQPSGRTITPSEAGALIERGDLGEHTYLRGSFVVTASGENRAVLRAQSATGDLARGSGAARVIVEYPGSAAPPPEGATFSRDENRAFEVRDVRRGEDGQINIYVREVTHPQ